jgi:uncharacterized iron-regulated membrane protein
MDKIKKQPSKSLFRRVTEFLHLWLGLITGIVVLVVCLTAAIWVFRDEIYYFTMPENRVEKQDKPYLAPSELMEKGKAYLQLHRKDSAAITIQMITYSKPGSAVMVEYKLLPDEYRYMLMNPYTGKVNYEGDWETRTEKFLLFVRAGHRFFWLPRSIGSPFVGTCCILFLIILITGLIWWYPKKWNAGTRTKSFAIKWKANWKRVNIDLHNVLGFYAFLVAIVLTFTGVTFTFSWFNNGYHKILTGRPYQEEENRPASHITPPGATGSDLAADQLWQQYAAFIKNGNDAVRIVFPDDSLDSWTVAIVPTKGRIANIPQYFYDQYSLKLIKKSDDYAALSAGEKLYRMTFDIHVATIWGLSSKIIAALASLIGASLPVTGFIIWYNRKFGKKKKSRQPAYKVTA